MSAIVVQIPATSANLGPGFDCLAVSLDIWNQVEFRLGGDGLKVTINGEGSGILPNDESNLIVQAFFRVYGEVGQAPPIDLEITCVNRSPIGSGLGSSASAVLAGLLGANVLLGKPLSEEAIIALGTELEGHPDNLVPAYYGGLALVTQTEGEIITRKVEIPNIQAVIVVPDLSLSTLESRQALPEQVSRADAVKNIGNTAILIEAFREGDVDLMAKVTEDALHQPYRLPLIPGAAQALWAAQELGAAACLSGAGPGVIAFGAEDAEKVAAVMQSAFQRAGLASRSFHTHTTNQGAQVNPS